jgi:predicted ATPase/class 3 adenylate cyclase
VARAALRYEPDRAIVRGMAEQPTGTVSLFFSDIEGSTRLLERLGRDRYAEALEQHRGLLRAAFGRHNGYEVDCEGDSFSVAFQSAAEAAEAAREAQRALAGAEWPDGCTLRVRMGLHSGEPLLAPPKYVGLDVHRAARIMAAAHGGQVLLSQTTRDLLGDVVVRDLGEHRLKDLTRPERIFQLGDGEFPPLKSLNRTNLPIAAGPLLGRAAELAQIRQLFEQGARLLTLTGPGGSGKTRLALQAAAELVEEFPDGVFFVALAPLADAAAVAGVVAQALGLRPDDDLYSYLTSRRLLVVLDNAEHLEGVERVVSELLVGEVVALVTSRAPLHLSAEHEFPVEPLSDEAAAELFVLRAAAVGRSVVPDAIVGELCRRLDNLPLAVELAAARAKLLAPPAILDRLDQALPFLTGGPRDAPERQRTLRATIEWSYELLSETERVALLRLAVFRGSFGLDAAEAVAGAEVDAIASLVDKSLLKPIGEERFLMLETLREFARERLDIAGETAETALRHARWYQQRLLEFAPEREGPRTPELLAWYDAESANTWAALDALFGEDVDEALSLADELGLYWIIRGEMKAGRDWLRAALHRDPHPTEARVRALARLGHMALQSGELSEAEEVSKQALELATTLQDELDVAKALHFLAATAYMQGEHERAVELGERAVSASERSGDESQLAQAEGGLSLPLTALGRFDAARQLLERNLAFYNRMGNSVNVAVAEINIAEIDLLQGNLASARKRSLRALETCERLGLDVYAATALAIIGAANVADDRLDEAVRMFGEALEAGVRAGDSRTILLAALGIATAAWRAEPRLAARTWAAAMEHADSKRLDPGGLQREQAERAMSAVRAAVGEAEFEQELERGRALTLDEAVALAREVVQQACR